MIRTIFAACLLAATPTAVAAQETVESDSAGHVAAARDAEETGRLMTAVLEANALAQRQFMGMIAGTQVDGIRGAVSLPGEASDVWLTTIFGQQGGAPDAPLVALAEYEISDGSIRSENIYEAGRQPQLEGDVVAMARAQIVAPRAVIASPNANFCRDGEEASDATRASVTFLTVALPPREDASFDTYVLNGPFEPTAIPLGKHYRVSFDEYGQIGEPELLTDTCEVIAWDEDSPDLETQVYVTEFPGRSAPTPVHAFISSQLPFRLGVVTGDVIWPMASGRIAPPVPASQAGF